MSKLIVEVCEVVEVLPMENSDFLEKVTIKGWDVVVQKALNLKPGDPVVYFPPDSVLTEELADRLGIRKYLAPVKGADATRYRVKAARLRGVASYGTIDHDVPDGFGVGDDVANFYGVTKWEPPPNNKLDGPGIRSRSAQAKPAFHQYKHIENLRNYRTAFTDGEEVVVTEKIHGSQLRCGYLKTCKTRPGIMGWFERIILKALGCFTKPTYAFMAGSHHVQRQVLSDDGTYTNYAIALADPNVQTMLKALSEDKRDVIMFGELIGSGVQDMTYGHTAGERSFRMFDITIDGKYVDADTKMEWFAYHNIPTVPVLYQGPFSWDLVEAYTDGPTTLCDPSKAGKFKGREGIVVTTLKEPLGYPGRKIFKSISADYLSRKNPTDSH